ncbi:hypothetical protein MUP01_11510 [Candidatus Bathyarchaeota archaeon]|nr:hypothetical protein [Candidatus Bathyarchaeota archaeon]
MHRSSSSNSLLLFSIFASIFGLLAVALFASLPPMIIVDVSWRKPLVGLSFTFICASGIVAAIFPNKCQKGSHFQEKRKRGVSNLARSASHSIIKGHHPDCGEFSAHVVEIRGRTFCAACTGLLIGAVGALLGTAWYFFLGWAFEQASFPLVLVGQALTACGFFQLASKSITRLFMNAIFVLGPFMILVGLDMLAKSVFIDFYVVGLIALWIWTRVLLSQWDHNRTCRVCTQDCGNKRKC